MVYFFLSDSIKKSKDKFRKYCKQFHPDLGGNEEEMKEMLRQWSEYKYTVEIEQRPINNTFINTVEITINKIIKETKLAYLVELPDRGIFNSSEWIPKSQVSSVYGNKIEISFWLFEKKFT